MEPKKNADSDLSKKSGLFMSIGLMLSLLFTITAFEWKSYDEAGLIDFGELILEVDELVEVPITVQPPPPPPAAPPEIVVVPNDQTFKVDTDFSFDTEILPDDIIDEMIDTGITDEIPDEVVDWAEVQPAPVGGFNEFYKFIAKNINYPKKAINTNTEGKVYVSFVVDKNGNLSDIKVLKGIGAGCDEEAIRVLGLAPKWSPGKQGARPVRSECVFQSHLN